MTDEEKLYVLMAQAEDLQKHAVELQNKAQETFSALPLAVGAGRAENTLREAFNGCIRVLLWCPHCRRDICRAECLWEQTSGRTRKAENCNPRSRGYPCQDTRKNVGPKSARR